MGDGVQEILLYVFYQKKKTRYFLHHSAPIAEALKKQGSLDVAKVYEIYELNKLFAEKMIICE